MTEKKVIIIGAGLAGLSAGCYARMNGFGSEIFEHHSAPGGVAACWKRKDFFIDGGIHFLMGYKPGGSIYGLYQELGALSGIRIIEMSGYGGYFDEVHGLTIMVTKDLDRLGDDLRALFPQDAGPIEDLISGSKKMAGEDLAETGLENPPELVGSLTRLKQFWGMWRFFKYFSGKYNRPVGEYVRDIKDPSFRKFFSNLFLPEVPVWFVYALLGMLAGGQLGIIEDGCESFVRAIERRYKELKGDLRYNARVVEILVENNRAVGVRLADGRSHRADYVVSAGDGHSTIFDLLGGRFVDEKIRQRYETWPLFRPWLTASFGAARSFAGESSIKTIVLKQPIPVGTQAADTLIVRIFNYAPRFAPPGKTVFQASFETDWDYWNDLSKDRAAYEAIKQRAASEILDRLSRYYPAIKDQIEMTDVATPYTTWRYTLNHRGAPEGFQPTPQTIMAAVRRTLPGLDNFYMAGQWVMPGGGVPPCLFSGRHAIQLICHQEKQRFLTSTYK